MTTTRKEPLFVLFKVDKTKEGKAINKPYWNGHFNGKFIKAYGGNYKGTKSLTLYDGEEMREGNKLIVGSLYMHKSKNGNQYVSGNFGGKENKVYGFINSSNGYTYIRVYKEDEKEEVKADDDLDF